MPSKGRLPRIAGWSALVVLLLTILLLGAGWVLSACFCIAMYGDPGNPCKAKSGSHMSGAEAEANRKMWVAGAKEASQRCGVRLKDLHGGAVFVAEGERAPRAKELLAHECGSFTEADRKFYRESNQHPPLRATNPALCDRLAAGPPAPEAFAFRQEGDVLYFYYFTYDDVNGHLRMRDVYSKIAMNEAGMWFGSPPMLDSGCWMRPVDHTTDLGSALLFAPQGYNCWTTLILDSEDPDTAAPRLCYSRGGFRRSTEKLEITTDGG